MSRTTHINARCEEDQKQRYIELSKKFGYENFSEFLIALLDSMADRYHTEDWESRLVYMVGNRVVAASSDKMAGAPIPTAAFPVVAPAHFWNHLDEFFLSGDASVD